jgi:hypothetical protein
MKRLSAVNANSSTEDKVEAWAKRIVMFMGLIGPITLVGLLLWIVHWDASQSARVVQQEYFPSAYVNAAVAAEQPIATF